MIKLTASATGLPVYVRSYDIIRIQDFNDFGANSTTLALEEGKDVTRLVVRETSDEVIGLIQAKSAAEDALYELRYSRRAKEPKSD